MFRLCHAVSITGLAAAVALSHGCGNRLERTLVRPEATTTLNRESPYLKVHMKNGDLYVLSDWSVSEQQQQVTGVGDQFDPNRRLITSDTFQIDLDGVALFETNVVKPSGVVAGFAVISVLSGLVTVACLSNTKACFGSCPTFYLPGDGDGAGDVLQAEGFSSSIAPSLEDRDIDALYRARPGSRTVSMRMTNEALETHVVRHVDLLVARRPASGRVVAAGDGSFWQVTDLAPPAACRAEQGDCLAPITAVDADERYSKTSVTNLAEREMIELSFDAPPSGPLGLVIEARQTFLSTFLFYQALAYMGTRAGDYLAALERGDPELHARAKSFHHVLGGIDVQFADASGAWHTAGAFDEVGPLATDVQVIRLPPGVDARRLRLRLTRGHWRLGYVALARVGQAVEPVRVRPVAVETIHGHATDALPILLDRDRTLVTVPGDEYRLHYELPADPATLELFLDSRGYYIEWMREEWLVEENPPMAALLLNRPELALRLLAPKFKKLEPSMEALFWKSRYARPKQTSKP